MIYFAADVHLGLPAGDASEREARFVSWLKSINTPDTEALYLLGDIWDFWYEYRDVIPRVGIRVIAAVIGLLDSGVKVYYFPGNHDIWLYSFWQELGVQVLHQPYTAVLGGGRFLLGHGDGLGGAKPGYRFMLKVFHNRICQKLFSTIHPRLAFLFGTDWSRKNRRSHGGYRFKGGAEPLYRFCAQQMADAATSGEPLDYCIFGHFHDSVDIMIGGARLVVLKDWIDGGVHYASWDGKSLFHC